MKFAVTIQPTAQADAFEAVAYIARHSPDNANKWYEGILATMQSLDEMPRRCPMAREARAVKREIRQHHFGVYRILFTILDSEVRILHIRHGARRTMRRDEIIMD